MTRAASTASRPAKAATPPLWSWFTDGNAVVLYGVSDLVVVTRDGLTLNHPLGSAINGRTLFAADIDATILTSDPDVNEMHIDFNGITVRREQVGNKTRIRATGKINGGGERVELYAEEGDIHISAQTLAPMRLANPK